jgi:glycosyltransferase involved in cell wall biosynthesis
MKIGIEGNPLFSFSGNLNGIGQFAKYLIEASADEEPSINFEIVRMLMPHRKFTPPLKSHSNISYRVVRWLPPIFYYQSFKRLGWAPPYDKIALRKYDLFIFFNFVTYPISKNTKSILFIYDLSFIHYGQYSSPKNKAYLEKFVPKSIDKATKIVTISKFAKNEICEYYGIPSKQVSIVNPAVDHDIFYPRDRKSIEEIKKKYKINQDYILCVCTIEPRKNLVGILNAYEKLPDDLKKNYTLVLAGGKGWLDDEIDSKIKEMSSNLNIIKTGYVPDEDLPVLYSGAEVFVFPSFYEGFGMPPLESMACGVPVITSDNSSLPEVVGDAGIMIKADNTVALSKEITRVLTDRVLHESLRKKGLDRSKQFSWNKSAEVLLDLIKQTTQK